MTTTYISYKTAAKLKEFLGKSAPIPIDGHGYIKGKDWSIAKLEETLYPLSERDISLGWEQAHAYQLHDLLSKPFCEAMAKAILLSGKVPLCARTKTHIAEFLLWEYYNDGLPAVEKALLEMMGAK